MTQQTRALICYDARSVAGNRDYQLASQLMQDLQRQNVRTQMSSYDNTPLLDDTYQWLIVIYGPHGVQPQVAQAIDTAMEQSVERKMRGVFLLTTGNPSTILPQWASIRSYNASSTAEANKAIDGLLQAMSRVKVPYDDPVQERQPVVGPTGQKKQFTPRSLAITIASIVVLLVVISVAVMKGSPDASPPSTSTTALVTDRTTPTSTPPSNTDAAQTLYNDITKPPPTVQGFQNNKQNWENDLRNCQLLVGDIYHAKTPTSGYYATCMAQNSQYKNFAYQVTLTITNNNVGGVIFRADDNPPSNYYIFSIKEESNSNVGFFIYYCRKTACTSYKVSESQPLKNWKKQVDPSVPMTLTVIAQDSKVNLYVQGKPVGDMDNIRPIVGKIGFYAASVNDKNPNTDVTFSDLKIWSLGQ